MSPRPIRKVLVCGGRDWSCPKMIRNLLTAERTTHSDYVLVVVHGAGKGADQVADQVAGLLGMQTIAMRALWERFARRAGPIRNDMMLRCHPDLAAVYGFHDDLDSSTGTKGMLVLAHHAGLPTFHIRHDGPGIGPCDHAWGEGPRR